MTDWAAIAKRIWRSIVIWYTTEECTGCTNRVRVYRGTRDSAYCDECLDDMGYPPAKKRGIDE